jgi:xylulose-5-phosphate/fructose-6-phosphate phosphoketolase
VMLNDLDRYKLAIDVLDRVPGLAARYGAVRQHLVDARTVAREYTREHGIDIPEVSQWRWPADEA